VFMRSGTQSTPRRSTWSYRCLSTTGCHTSSISDL